MKVIAFLLAAWIAATAHAQLPAAELAVGMHRIRAEVANDMGARMQGLMRRKSMPQGSGMVFVFEENATHCMWMKNTLIPLSVAFVDAQGAIVNVADMQPHSEQSHCSTRPARYALEMKQGWFREKGLKPGVKLRGIPGVAAN